MSPWSNDCACILNCVASLFLHSALHLRLCGFPHLRGLDGAHIAALELHTELGNGDDVLRHYRSLLVVRRLFGRQPGRRVAVERVQAHLHDPESEPDHIRELQHMKKLLLVPSLWGKSWKRVSSIYIYKLQIKIKLSRIIYSNIFVLDEKAVEEPDDGTDGEREGEGERHELHASSTHHLTLQSPMQNVSETNDLSKVISEASMGLRTMMLSGATKTLTEKPTQTQPRRTRRFSPAARKSVRRTMSPNTPTFRSSMIFAVNSCEHLHVS
jgi:hypothetical protein